MRYKAMTCISLSRFQCSTKSGLSIVQACVRSKDFVQSIPVTRARTLYNSNLWSRQLEGIFISLQIVLYIVLPSIARTIDISKSAFFLFPLKVRIMGVDCNCVFVWLVVFRFEILSAMDHRVRKKWPGIWRENSRVIFSFMGPYTKAHLATIMVHGLTEQPLINPAPNVNFRKISVRKTI